MKSNIETNNTVDIPVIAEGYKFHDMNVSSNYIYCYCCYDI